MYEADALNEIASLLHITSEIASNHPNLGAIGRACQRRLVEINAEQVDAEAKEADDAAKAEAEKQAADYKAPKEGDPNYVAPEKPLEETAAPTTTDAPSDYTDRRV